VAYDDYVAANPDGSTQTGVQLPAGIKVNLLALRDSVIAGGFSGFNFSLSGGTAEEPAQILAINGSTIIRGTLTWTSGQITQIVWAQSLNGSLGPFNTMRTETLSYDGSGNLVSSGGGGFGFMHWVAALGGKFKALRTSALAHFAAGLGAHGIGSLATQNKNTVDITGGTALLTWEREVIVSNVNINAGTTINWSSGGQMEYTITGSGASFSHVSLPSGAVGYITLLLHNAGLATLLFPGVKFPGGVAPSLTASGKDRVTLCCSDGQTIDMVGFAKDLR